MTEVRTPRGEREQERGAGSPNAYLGLLRRPGALGFCAAGFIGRMPMSMFGLGTVLLIAAITGRYGMAGAVAAAGSVGYAISAPQLAKLTDRLGQHRVLRRSYDEFLSNTVFGLTCRLGHHVPGVIRTVNAAAGQALGSRTYTDAAYRVFTSPRRVRFKEQEYALPRAALAGVLGEIRAEFDRRDWRISFPIEVRVAPSDDLWLSTAYGRDSAYIAIHVYHASPHHEYFRAVEDLMVAVGGRPHWGKMHTRDAGYLSGIYPRFGDFVALRDRMDPERRFGNAYLEQVLGA